MLVNDKCAVLAGQANRARGGLPFNHYASFEAALDELLATERLATDLGESGRAFVERMYRWPIVLERLEHLVHVSVAHAAQRWPARAAAR